MSLVLTLLGHGCARGGSAGAVGVAGPDGGAADERAAARRAFGATGAAFALGALGSVLGALLAYANAAHGPAALRMPSRFVAAQCAAALLATCVGGSVMATSSPTVTFCTSVVVEQPDPYAPRHL
jgi:hypothetical protein